MAGTRLRRWIERGLFAVGAGIVLWVGIVVIWLASNPTAAFLAFASDAYPRVPAELAGGILRISPYDPNGNTWMGQPLLHAAASNHGLVGSSEENSLRALRIYVAKGADVDVRFHGRTALHDAILAYAVEPDQDLTLIRTLLDLGADPAVPQSTPGKPTDGMNAVDYAEHLAAKRPVRMQPVLDLLRASATTAGRSR